MITRLFFYMLFIITVTFGDSSLCQYHFDELSKAMEKARLYAQNNMVREAKRAVKNAVRHNIEAQAECKSPEALKVLRKTLPSIKNGITVNGKSILKY